MSSKEGNTSAAVGWGSFITTATGYVTGALGGIASLLGFGSPGITSNSAAAAAMSYFGTSGIGGWIISSLQSIGVTFVNTWGASTVAALGAIATPITAGGIAATYAYNNSQKKKE